MLDAAEVTLRPITPEDTAFLFAVYASTRAEELAAVRWSEAEKEEFLRMQSTMQHRFYQAHFPAAAFQVVLRRGSPIGRLYVDRRPEEIRIVDVALLPEHRGAGIGSALIRDALAEALDAGKPVRIHVERLNPALSLYGRLGFVPTGDAGVYLLLEWAPERGASRQVKTAS